MIASEMEAAPALVLLHGFTNTGASWQPVIAGLGESYTSIAPDIRGHGAASALGPVTLDAVITDIAATAPRQFTLGGYSMGGRIALHVALALGDRVRALVLISASPGIADESQRAARRESDEALAREIERLPIHAFARRWSRNPVLAGLPASLAAAAHEDRLRNTPSGLARALRGLGTGTLPSLWGHLVELSMPVTVVAGARDERFTAMGEAMARAIPGAALEVLDGVGHAVHLEAPDRLAELIRRTGSPAPGAPARLY